MLAGILTAAVASSGLYFLLRENPEEKIIRERQTAIEWLAEKQYSGYVKKVYYDHDKSLIKRFPQKYADSIFKDERKWQWLVEVLQQAYEEQGYARKITKEFLNERATRKMLDDMVKKGLEESIKAQIKDDPALVLNYMPFLGRGEKSEIYFFKQAFEKEERTIGGKPLEIKPDDKLWVVYKHECFHARDIARGLELGREPVINYKNYAKVDSQVLDFLIESNAYIDTFEFFKPYWLSTPLLYAAGKLDGFADQFRRFTESRSFSLSDEKLMVTQINRYNMLFSDMNRLFEEYAKSK